MNTSIQTFTLPTPELTTTLTESGQKNLIRFAYTDEKGNALHQFVKCRDYLGDVLWGEKWNKSITKYGFTWNPLGFNQDRTRFILEMDQPHLELLKINLEDLKKVLKDDTITIVVLPKGLPNSNPEQEYVYIEANSYWMMGIPHISFYTYMIKLYASYTLTEISEYLYLTNKDTNALYSENKYSMELNYIAQLNSAYDAPFKEKSFSLFVDYHRECLASLPNPLQHRSSEAREVHNNSGFIARREEIYKTLNNLCIVSPAIAA